MNKLCSLIVTGFILSFSTPIHANSRAVEVVINGIGPAVDGAAFLTVRQVIGYAVGNGVIDTFIVSGYGREGGFSACAQAAPSITSDQVQALVRQLRSIVPNPVTTVYSVTRTSSCAGGG